MPRYTKDDVEILIATMERAELSFLESIFCKPLEEINHNLLIVNQSKTKKLSSQHDHIRVVNDVNFGLSRSRNQALKNAIKPIVWILDDDCEVVEGATDKIAASHSKYPETILTFQTIRRNDAEPFWNYPIHSKILGKRLLKKVLSPEITCKIESFRDKELDFDLRFGLGAQFQDSENYIFFEDALRCELNVRFIPKNIVIHDPHTSSDEASSDRLIYARGALAARQGLIKASYLNYKYTFFLWRKGLVKGFKALFDKHKTFERGANDYWSGFEGHRIKQEK